MIRYAAFVSFACLYVAASVVLVRSQGQAYREASRRTLVSANNTSAVPAKPDADHTETTRAEKTASVPTPSKADESSQSASDQPIPTPPPKANENREPSPPPRIQVTEAKPSTTAPRLKPTGPAGNAPSSAAAAWSWMSCGNSRSRRNRGTWTVCPPRTRCYSAINFTN